MERTLSDEEKFRKAEEIYNRRRNMNVTVASKDLNRSVSTEKKDFKKMKKMLFQIGICICIYFSIYFIQYSNYYFSNDVVKRLEEVLSYDINFSEGFKQFNEFMKNNNFFNGVFLFFSNDKDLQKEEDAMNIIENDINLNTIENEYVLNTLVVDDAVDSVVDNSVENKLGIGGGEEADVDSSISSDERQMLEDAKSIKDNYKVTLPLRGTVTSRYGDRDIEPKFHTGIDVARDTGSDIISATEGTVILVDEQTSYGKVLKIQTGDVVSLYAHCNEILVEQGDKVNIMQKIAKVGSTGNSTGPHLHFEIIYCGRYVNPEYVLEFKE